MPNHKLVIPAVALMLLNPAFATASAVTEQSSKSKSSASSDAKPKSVIADATQIDGVIPMYQKGKKLYAELSSKTLNSEFMVLTSIARGIGKMPLLGGMTWGFEDDWVWRFRKIGDQIHVIRRNVRFRANESTPEASAVSNAYTDSVLFSLPIIEKGPGGGDIVDMTRIFMSDLPQISHVLEGYRFASDRSYWADVKGFDRNLEIEVAATYASDGRKSLDTVADSRGVTVHVHYSISRLDATSYKPRLADDRVGYFVTAVKDFTDSRDDDGFVRYINRWHLEKADPTAELSPPKNPIVFWIENTVPFKYRNAVREGILAWNKAFEQAGFQDAIEVRQQPENADWAPEDIYYNTFRWMTANAGFAMGPSRVNPYTGQILDADIIFDADFVKKWSDRIETLTPERVSELTGGPLDLESYRQMTSESSQHRCGKTCCRTHGLAQQILLAEAAIDLAVDPQNADALREELILQGVKEVVMHEVGHTLGLRHNFKASAYYDLNELNDSEKTRKTGITSSVMDYTPVNIVPLGEKQGDYFSSTVGPYDVWAIEYGYSTLGGSKAAEKKGLAKIAERSTEPGLAFATDEDARGIDPDPYTNRYDLGDDPVRYAAQRETLVKQLIAGLTENSCREGDCDGRTRKKFNSILANYGRAMHFAARTIGGVRISRNHYDEADAPPISNPVSADKQREALTLLETAVFGKDSFQFPAKLYTHMGASHWGHWGTEVADRPDYPVAETVLMWQDRILDQMLSPLTLDRVADNELKTPAESDAFSTAELIERLTGSIFGELYQPADGEYSNRKPAINQLRRNLQRSYLDRLSKIALADGSEGDASAIATSQLRALKNKSAEFLEATPQLDSYSHSHLEDAAFRIDQVLTARYSLRKSA